MRRAFVLCGLLATTAGVRADTSVRQPVVGFRVRGNSKLTDRTLGYVIHVELGELKGDDDIAEIDQALHTSELFETVKVTLEEAPGGVVIVADLEDKHSWIIAPTAFLLPGNRAFGVGYAENDLGGEDAKLLLYAQIGDHTSLGFGTYLDPAFRGTKLQFRVDLYPLHKQIVEYANADPRSQVVARETTFTFLDAGVLVGWVFQWWLIADVRFRGAYQYFRNSHLDDAALTPVKTPEKDGWDIGVQTRLTIDARHHHFGLTWGPYVQLQLEKSVPGLDSYGYGDFLLRAYYSWALFCDHELELRTHLSAGYHLPLNEDLTLGGVSDLRGYNVDQFRGDVRTLFRAEYSLPITRWRFLSFRALGFWDTGYIGNSFQRTSGDRDYLDTQKNGSHWWRNDVGAGLRVYVSTIVLPLLGLDFGYGIEGHSPEIYFEVGLTDF